MSERSEPSRPSEGAAGVRGRHPTDDTRGSHLRIVRGDPTPEEVAALVAVLATSARPNTAGDRKSATVSRWADRSRGLRRPLPHGPGAWRSSAFTG